MSSAIILKALILHRIWKNKKSKKRECMIRPIFEQRNVLGEHQLVADLRNDPHYHHRYFRMNLESFDEIFVKIKTNIEKNPTHSRPITALQRLSITLRYLASGNSQISLAMSYRISPSAVGTILRETLTAIIDALQADFLPTPTEQTWIENEKIFREKWQFPNAVGALDGKHCRIRCPSKSASKYFNYKSYFSIVLLAVVNANYEFVLVNIGASGSQSDSGILMRSEMGKMLENGNLQLPGPKAIQESSNISALPHVILSDEGLPLKQNMMRPFSGKYLPEDQRIFNYRLSRGRLVVEDAFGILSARWRILHTTIEADVDLAKLIVTASVILHNFLMKKGDHNNITASNDINGVVTNGNWKEVTENDDGMEPITEQDAPLQPMSALEVRNSFKDYFNSDVGALHWQKNHVNGGM